MLRDVTEIGETALVISSENSRHSLTSNTPQSICNPRAASTPPCQFCAPKKALDYLESQAVDGPLSVFDNAPELALPFFHSKVNKRLIGFVRRKMTYCRQKQTGATPLNPRETCARRGT
jgi:hypothetical protein